MKHTTFLSLIVFANLTLVSLSLSQAASEPKPAKTPPPANRAASFYISEDFINEQLAAHMKTNMFKDMKISLDADNGMIFLRGIVQAPIEELRAINLDPQLGKFHFQFTIEPKTTKKGHLILELPLNKTYFYPASTKDSEEERIIVPVQMLSLALASVRGYLAALSGDFNGFDRQTKKLEALLKALDHSIAVEKNADALEDLKNQRESLRLQLAAVPIERKQLQTLSKEFASILGFTGEKELSLNDELAAHKNALVLKIKLSQLAPYLTGVELGGVRIMHDKKDGGGKNYLVIDINADLANQTAIPVVTKSSGRPGMKTAPSLIIRLNQALLESEAVVSAEQKKMGSKLRDFDMQLKDDGLHVAGKWKAFLFSVPFDTVVDFNTIATDVFEMRVREIKVAGIDFDFLTGFVLESIKNRLDQSLKGACTFKEVTDKGDGTRTLQATVDPKKLVPAFPDLHLVNVDVREREFLLKIGHP